MRGRAALALAGLLLVGVAGAAPWQEAAADAMSPAHAAPSLFQEAPDRYAVVVGISDYLHFEDEEGGDLPGARRDALAMRDVLVGRWGFTPENVLLLLDGEATRAAIEAALTGWLPERVEAHDQVVFYFAGHGSQIWDQNGDEEDGLDETIAPADVDPVDPSMDIVDEELGEWLRALPTADVWYVHDNCSAATGTRAATPFARTRALNRDRAALQGAPSAARRALAANPDASGYDVADTEILELAASQPNQVALDVLFDPGDGIEPFHGGAFTTFLVQELWRAPATATYAQVFRAVGAALDRHNFQQEPHLTNAPRRDTPLFGGSAAVTGVPVLEVQGGMARLGAGAALGLLPGSVLETEEGGRLEVSALDRDRASADVLSGEVAAGSRAHLVAHPVRDAVLVVSAAGVDSGTGMALAEALAGDPTVRLETDEEAFAHLILRRQGTEIRVLGQDGFTRHVTEAGAAGAGELAAALRRQAAALTLAELENPGQGFTVEVELEGGARAVGLGEAVEFTVRSGAPGYLTLVDLGTDGTVTVLIPNAYQGETRIGAGESAVFPSAEMGFEILAIPPVGRGMVRAFVTPEPLGFQPGEDFASGDPGMAREVRDALLRAVGTTGDGALLLDGWGTASLVYEIRP